VIQRSVSAKVLKINGEERLPKGSLVLKKNRPNHEHTINANPKGVLDRAETPVLCQSLP